MSNKTQTIPLALDKPQVVLTAKGANNEEALYLSVKGQDPESADGSPGDYDFGTELSADQYAELTPGTTTLECFTEPSGEKLLVDKKIGFLPENFTVTVDTDDTIQDSILRLTYVRVVSPLEFEMSPL